MNIFHGRQGQMETSLCYFYTDTIHDFKHLLADDEFKMICIDSWKYLTEKKLIKIYGYVIMPNHIHLLWMMTGINGKESPAGSFAKFTAHQFKKVLREKDTEMLIQYKSQKTDRLYQFWKRDPLAISITSKKALLQKLDYIHNNPVQEKWKLASLPEDYRWSSASFYLTGIDEFGILTHYDE
jgi:REP element-mobilizing transposase RayT